MHSKYYSKKTIVDNIKFDSKREAEYYSYVLKPLYKSGRVEEIEFQPKFELQPAFEKDGKKYRPITYTSDFKVTWRALMVGDVAPKQRIEIIEVKGYETELYKVKRKMFEYKYKNMTIKVVR